MRPHNTICPAKRLKTAKVFCAREGELGIAKHHLIVLTTIAGVYGCVHAIRVMKFSPILYFFNPSSTLGYIWLIPRIRDNLAQTIQHAGMQDVQFIRRIFVIAASPLHQLFSYFFLINVSTPDTEESSSEKFS